MKKIYVYDAEADLLERLAEENETSEAEIVEMLMDYLDEMKVDYNLVGSPKHEVKDNVQEEPKEQEEPSKSVKDTENTVTKSMNAETLDVMVKAMRTGQNEFESRMAVTDTIRCLYNGLQAIHRDDLANELIKLYEEIENVETNDIVRIGTFRKD